MGHTLETALSLGASGGSGDLKPEAGDLAGNLGDAIMLFFFPLFSSVNFQDQSSSQSWSNIEYLSEEANVGMDK
jgi:hypothetical protein